MKTLVHKARHLSVNFRVLLIVWVIGLTLSAPTPAHATHVVGSDWSWRCIPGSNGLFELTLVLYRDCGAPGGTATLCPQTCGAACPQSISIQGADPGCMNNNYGSVQLSLISVRDVGYNPRCPNSKNTCNNMTCVDAGTFTPGVERYEFKGTINLGASSGIPTSCCNVRMSYSLCCRNSIISTGAANRNFYTEATINRCLSTNPCNSSPTLTNDPFAVLCSGQPFVYNNGAVDPDLDSLAYSFTPSLEATGASVPYTPPYAAVRPMPWSGPANGVFPAGISCSPINGDIMFTPAAGGNFVGVMAVQVQQWRKNASTGIYELVGTTRRDIQMWLKVCDPNNPPTLKTNPGLNGNPLVPKTNWEICAGEQVCFDVIAKDTDFNPPTVSDTTYLSWNMALAGYGATFLPNYVPAQRRLLGPREDSYRFCWTPPESMGSPLPYYFTVKGEDSRCPIPGTIIRAFSVRVYERPSVILQKQDHKCGKWAMKYVKTINRHTYTSATWSIANQPGDFAFTQGAKTFQNVETTPILTFPKGGKYLVNLTITMPGPPGTPGCAKTFVDTLTVIDPLTANVRDTFICKGSSVTLTTKAENGSAPYTYRWFNNMKDTLAPLNAPFFTQPNFTVSPTETRYYTVQVRDLNGCRSWDSIRVLQLNAPIGILPDSMRICYGSTYMLDPGGNGGNIKSYLWNTGDTTRSIERSDSGTYSVLLTDTAQCFSYDTLRLYVNRQIIPNAGIDTAICFRDTATLHASGGYMYQWRNLTSGTMIGTKTHNPVIYVNPTTATKYEVMVYQTYPDTNTNYLECSVADTVEVTVKPLPALIRPAVVRSCFSNKQVALNAFNTNQPGGTGIWTYRDAAGAVINGTPVQIHVDSLTNRPAADTVGVYPNWIQYRYTAPIEIGGCTNVDSAQLMIYGNPRVNAGVRQLLCENAPQYELTLVANQANRGVAPVMLTGNLAFSWSGQGVDSTILPGSKKFYFKPNRSDITKLPGINILTYRYTHTYALTGGGSLACTNTDTTQFVVVDVPEIDAGSDIKICKNNPVLNLTDASGGFTVPSTGAEYWVAENPFIQGGISGRTAFNPGATGVPNSGGPWRLFMRDTSTGCFIADTINLIIAQVPDVTVSFSPDVVKRDIMYCKNTGKHDVYTYINGALARGTTDPADSTYSYLGNAAWGPVTTSAPPAANAFYDTDHPDATGIKVIKFQYTQVTAGIACTSYDTAILGIQPPPEIDATTPSSICDYTESVPIGLNKLEPSIYTMIWASGDGTFENANAPVTRFNPNAASRTAGIAKIWATTVHESVVPYNVCDRVADTVYLNIIRSPEAQVQCANCDGCEPLTSTLSVLPTGVDNALYQWIWNDGYAPNANDSTYERTFDKYVNHKERNVKLVVATQTTPMCFDTSTIQPVFVRATPKPSFTPDPPYTTIAKPFFNFINGSTSPDNADMFFDWTFPPLAPSPKERTLKAVSPTGIEFDADTGFIRVYLKATTQYGCFDTTSREVKVEPDITVFVPNAFRPGSTIDCIEGEEDCNSVFKISAHGYATIDIIIYNRWGQEVFRTNDAKVGWNGYLNNKKSGGNECPQDVYIYQIYATSFNGKQYKYSGSITLIR